MSGRWTLPGVPHKGWHLVNSVDLKPADSKDEYEHEKCEMCRTEGLRYVHYMEHPEYDGVLSVGSTCAEKMAEEYVDPDNQESMSALRQNDHSLVTQGTRLLEVNCLPLIQVGPAM